MNRGSKVAESTAQAILSEICRGGLKVGSHLPGEAAMLQQYGVGRGSLREALRILEVHGIIKIKAGPGGGPFVTGATTRNFGRMATMFFEAGGMTFREVIEARLTLEPIIARLAAEQRDPALVCKLLDSPTSLASEQEYFSTSADFHRQVASMSGNKILSLISHAMEDIFHARVAGMLFPPERRGDVADVHDQIAKAIANGEGAEAERLMRDHMTEYARYVEARYPALMDEVVAWL